jgi:hypothetical protein
MKTVLQPVNVTLIPKNPAEQNFLLRQLETGTGQPRCGILYATQKNPTPVISQTQSVRYSFLSWTLHLGREDRRAG